MKKDPAKNWYLGGRARFRIFPMPESQGACPEKGRPFSAPLELEFVSITMAPDDLLRAHRFGGKTSESQGQELYLGIQFLLGHIVRK